MKLLRFFALFVVIISSQGAGAIDVQGHRGARAVLPENTLPGFEYALNKGVDTLELDMGVSRDGVVVVIHDQTINPDICKFKDGSSIRKKTLVHELNLSEIKSLDCGSRLNPKFPQQTLRPGAEIPTLAEVFELVMNSDHANAKTVKFNIETKSNPDAPNSQPSPKEFVRLVLETVDQYELRERVTIQSFDHRTLLETKIQAPKIKLAALFSKKPQDWVSATRAARADIVSPYYKHIEPDDVTKIHAAGLLVIPWTSNHPDQWRQLLKMNVDGIITDDPATLLTFLENR